MTKLWSERDFDECCFAVDGVGPATMVCAASCRGSYCDEHRRFMVEAIAEEERIRRHHINRQIKLAAIRPAKPTPPRVALADIARQVAEHHGVSVAEIVGPSVDRTRIVPARHEFFYLASAAGRSRADIARFCGHRHHTTVTSGIQRQKARIAAAFAQEAA